MAAQIKDVFGVESELISGSGGIFDVVADGKLIFSKHETGRFPDPDEVIESLQDLKA